MPGLSRKRVVIDASPLLYGAKMGIGRTTFALIDAIAKTGCEYYIVLWGRRLQGKSLFRHEWRFPLRRLRLPRSAEAAIKALGLVELLCPGDIYHATDFYMPLKRPERAVATIHDLIFLVQPEVMVDHVRLAQWVPEFARRCQHIVAVSEFTRQDIVCRFQIEPDKVTVIHWGVDHEAFHPDENDDALRERLAGLFGLRRPYFLAVSCSMGRKNTPFLLSTYEKLIEDDPEHDLVLVWQPPVEIRERYEAKQFNGKIHFIGPQTDEALRLLYCGATALLFPSLYEGFGLPIVEAMACGTPVITSNVTSMPEVGGDAALYIDPYDEQSLLRALELFENKAAPMDALRKQGIQQAARFTWEQCAEKTLDVYRRCLES